MVVNIKGETNSGNFEETNTVKRYFARIFSVLSKETREKLMNLNVSEEKRRKIKKELAFLSKNRQKAYLEELFLIYNRKVKDI